MRSQDIKEREADAAIERQASECAAAESGARTGRMSCALPNLSTLQGARESALSRAGIYR